MTSKALVQIEADVSKFAAGVKAGTDAALRRIILNVRPLGEQIADGLKDGATRGADAFPIIDAEFTEVMNEVVASADRHFDQVVRVSDDAAEEMARDFGGAGEKVEDSLNEVGDRSKKEFDRVERNAHESSTNIGSTFRRLAGVVAAAFATIQIGRFFIQAAQDAEDLGSAIENTQQIIKSTGGAAGLLAADIRNISRELSLKIGVDSVEVQNAANILLTFKGVSKATFSEAIGLAGDLSAVLGSDLSGATLQLGKALNDPIKGVGALARAGVQFTQSQRDQIKSLVESGKLLQAQNIILKEVRSQVGGVAEAGVDTTDKLKVAFQDLKREAGEALISFIDKSGPQLISIVERMGPVVGRIGGVLADAFTTLLPIIEVVAVQIQQSFAAFGPAVRPIADALNAVLSLLPKILPTLVQIGQTLLPPIATMINIIAVAITPVIGLFLDLGSALASALVPILPPLTILLGQVAEVLAAGLMQILPPLADALIQLGPPLLALLIPALQILLTVVEPLLPPLLTLVNIFTGALAAALGALLAPLAEIATFLAENKVLVWLLVAAFSAWALVVNGVNLALHLLKVVTVAYTAVQWLLNAALDANPIGIIIIAVAALVAVVILAWKHSEAFRKIVLAVWGAIKVAAAAIGNAFVAAWHAVSDFFVGLGRWFSDLPANIGRFLAELPAVIGRALMAAFDAGLKAIGIGIGLTLAAIVTLPKLIINALLALPGLLADFFGFLWDSVVAAFHRGIDLAVFALTELPARALGAVLRFNQVMRDGFISAMKAVGRAVADGVSAVLSFFGSLPGRIVGLGPKMLAAGKSLIKGFFDGLSAVGGFLGDVGSAVLRGLKAGLNHVIRAINSGIASVDDALPFVKLPRLPELASGGLTTDTGLAVLHPRELVLPLEDRRAVDLLGQALAEADAGLRATGVLPSPDAGELNVRIFIGTREITDIVDVQIDERNRDLKRRVTAGSGRSR